MPRILVADPIAPAAVEMLRQIPDFDVTLQTGMSPDQVRAAVQEHDALIVRSATKVTADVLGASGRLRAIGRAGTGVDNIDLDAATRAGVVVMNTPGGNSVAAAELTMALLLAMARHVPQADAELKQGRWERKRFVGNELCGKALGVLGLGRIGREVAARARAFRMDVIGHDPFVPAEAAAGFGVKFLPLEQVISEADVLTLHLPMSEETRHLIDARRLSQMKRGAFLINCARGGLVDESALLEALEREQLAGAALDVFEQEPPEDPRLTHHPRVVSTPHLGASTHEAQQRVGIEIAEKIRDYLQGGMILDAVNFPSIDRAEYQELGPVMQLAERLGSFLTQVAEGGFRRLALRTHGTLDRHALQPLAMAAAKGLLTPLLEGDVSYVNALTLARERGIDVEQARSTDPTPYAGLLRLSLETESGTTTVAGTLFGADRPRLVEIDGVAIEATPAGHLLVLRNRDVPGVIGRLGTILGEAGINIAGLKLGRVRDSDGALSIVDVDGPVPRATLDRIRAIPEIRLVRSVSV